MLFIFYTVKFLFAVCSYSFTNYCILRVNTIKLKIRFMFCKAILPT